MKTWIKENRDLVLLHEGIHQYKQAMAQNLYKQAFSQSKRITNVTVQIQAIKKIQHLWRASKIKEAFSHDAYSAYLSMVAHDDKQRLLSSIMFGRHQAELGGCDPDRLLNPYIHEKADYHRTDDLSGDLLAQIRNEFDITDEMVNGKLMLPVVELKLLPFERLMASYPSQIYSIVRKAGRSIVIVLVPKDDSKKMHPLITAGLIASPWEIAQNITILPTVISDKNIKLCLNELPATKNALMKSDLFYKLKQTEQNKIRPTNLLAASLIQLITHTDKLTTDAIKRIALMIDMANTFYERKYSNYAFCVYAVIHELSLSIAMQTNVLELDAAFENFLSESKESLTRSLGLNESELSNLTFIAAPALSGTNAFMIAKRIALTMRTKTGMSPSIKAYKPCYFEFDISEFQIQTQSSLSDIFLLSTGPIVTEEGVVPGLNLNYLVREKIIKRKRINPTILMIDTTATLYKNLHLDTDVKQLVLNGKLSIIVFESHQKFGAVHSDQAQYGRVFCLCSTFIHHEEMLQEIQNAAQLDFKMHLDMRVGAYISHSCKDILEKIKHNHFKNGAVFSRIFKQMNLPLKNIVTHKYMLNDLNELYFTVPDYSWRQFEGVIPFRSSFGHYTSTISLVNETIRICPNASDESDALIQSTSIYFALIYSDKELEKIIMNNSRHIQSLSYAEQILVLSLMSNIINPVLNNQPSTFFEQLTFYCSINNNLRSCISLKGRESHVRLSQYFYILKQNILTTLAVLKIPPYFLNVIQMAYDKDALFHSVGINFFCQTKIIEMMKNNQLIMEELISTLSILHKMGIELNGRLIDCISINPSIIKIISILSDSISNILMIIGKNNKNSHQNNIDAACFMKKCCIKINDFFIERHEFSGCKEINLSIKNLVGGLSLENKKYYEKLLFENKPKSVIPQWIFDVLNRPLEKKSNQTYSNFNNNHLLAKILDKALNAIETELNDVLSPVMSLSPI